MINATDMKIICTLYSTIEELKFSIKLGTDYWEQQQLLNEKSPAFASYGKLLAKNEKSTDTLSLQVKHAEEVASDLFHNPLLKVFLDNSEVMKSFVRFCKQDHSDTEPLCCSNLHAQRIQRGVHWVIV